MSMTPFHHEVLLHLDNTDQMNQVDIDRPMSKHWHWKATWITPYLLFSNGNMVVGTFTLQEHSTTGNDKFLCIDQEMISLMFTI